jgi:single-strand DNA-binding protein
MSSVNKYMIVGSVGTINELKGTEPNQVLTFSAATSDYAGKGKGDARDGQPTDYKTTWHDITVFGKSAVALSKRLGKGDKVYAEGSLSKETYTKADGSTGHSERMKANQVTIIHSKLGATAINTATATTAVADEELPF